MFLAPTLARILEPGGRVALHDEGGALAVVLRPVPAAQLETYGRVRTAVTLAEWLVFQMSIWHEIATWYGWSSVPPFPERQSAFSPEDLYSNALGIRLAGGVIALRAAATDRIYERTLDRWLQEALAALGAVDAEIGRAAADQVDGSWWDSRRRVPDDRLVLRRNFDTSSPVVPWTVGRRGAVASAWEAAHCPGGASPAPLPIIDRLGELRFGQATRDPPRRGPARAHREQAASSRRPTRASSRRSARRPHRSSVHEWIASTTRLASVPRGRVDPWCSRQDRLTSPPPGRHGIRRAACPTPSHSGTRRAFFEFVERTAKGV
jgi:hypothetical protein